MPVTLPRPEVVPSADVCDVLPVAAAKAACDAGEIVDVSARLGSAGVVGAATVCRFVELVA